MSHDGSSRLKVIITAEPESALVELCGISLLERLLGFCSDSAFAEATILVGRTRGPSATRRAPSWARASLGIEICEVTSGTVTAADIRKLAGDAQPQTLLIDGGTYFDAAFAWRSAAATIGTAVADRLRTAPYLHASIQRLCAASRRISAARAIDPSARN